MAKRASKATKSKVSVKNSVPNVIFHMIFALINIFIYIGEVTRILITTPKILFKYIKKINRFFQDKLNDGNRAIISYFQTIKRNLFSTNSPKVSKKTSDKSIQVMATPVKMQKKSKEKPRRERKILSFRLPNIFFSNFKLPRLSLPKLNFFRKNSPKQARKLKKDSNKEIKSFSKKKRGKGKIANNIGYFRLLGSYLFRFLRGIVKVLLKILSTVRNFFLTLFLFLVFIIKKPFEFLFSLFTVQFRFFMFGILICAIFFVTRELHQFVINLPSPKDIGKVNYSLATHLNDRNGKLLYEIYRDEKRTPINIDKLPKYVTQASIAIEDKEFYKHKGISPISGILRASRETVFKGTLQGGSTITQQLVKTALLTPERTFTRKLKEIILALWTEQMYTKEQILQMYLNQVPYGGAAYGIEEASKTYFGKDAKELTIAEAALLAGLPQAPSQYSPFVDPTLAIARRNDVLLKMKEQRYITDSQYQVARSTPLEIIKPEVSIKAPHFVFYVKSELEKEYGTRMIEQGGLKVTTSLDLEVQQEVEKILKDELAKQKYLNVNNGAVLVTKPSTGEIIAMVGSVNYFQQPDGAFNVTTAERQPGSSLKPLLYSLAMQKGYTAATIIPDAPTTFVLPGADPYRPSNYDGKFHGNSSLRVALANSYNIPAVKALYAVGIDSFVGYMKNLGISTWNDPGRYVLPMALGGVEVKMVDEATAYGALANEGNKVSLTGVVKLEDSRDQIMSELKPDKTQVMPTGISYIISDILADNAARIATFGPGSQLEIPGYKVAVKTGTTDSKKDNWAFGYTPEYLVSVWIGNNDSTPMNPAIESGATGASSLWHRVMEYLLKNKAQHPKDWFPKPDDIVEKTCFGKTEYFLAGTENVSCTLPSPTAQPRKNQPQRNFRGQDQPVNYNTYNNESYR